MTRGPLPRPLSASDDAICQLVLKWAPEHLSELDSRALGIVRKAWLALREVADEKDRATADQVLGWIATNLVLIEFGVEFAGRVGSGRRHLDFTPTPGGYVAVDLGPTE